MQDVLKLRAFSVDLPGRVVFLGQTQHARLSAREVLLLGYLAERAGTPCAREELQVHIGARSGRGVDIAVFRLRKKIEQDPSEPLNLLTVHGEGYSLVLAGPPLVRPEPQARPQPGSQVPPHPIRAASKRHHLADCTVDLDARQVLRPSGARALTHREAQLLRYMMARPNRPIRRQTLLSQVWGYRSARSNAVASAMNRLRKKIEREARAPVHLITQGDSYLFRPTAGEVTTALEAHWVRFHIPESAVSWDVDPATRLMETADLVARVGEHPACTWVFEERDGVVCGGQEDFARWAANLELTGVSVLVSEGRVTCLPSTARVGGLLMERQRQVAGRMRPGQVWVSAELAQRWWLAEEWMWIHTPSGAVQLHELRPGLGPLLARQEELSAVRRALRDHQVVQLTGPPGVGKSFLAEHVRAGFHGRSLTIDLGQHPSPSSVVDSIARQLGVEFASQGSGAGRGAAAGWALAELGAVLLVLDGGMELDAALEALVSALAARAPEARWLLAGGRPSTWADLQVPLAPLAPEQAQALMVLLSGLPERLTDGEHRDLVAAQAQTGGLPLAVRMLAEGIQTQGLAWAVRAQGLQEDSELGQSLALAWSVLSPEAQGVLARLSAFDGPFNAALAGAVAPGFSSAAPQLLRTGHLQARPGGYALLAPVRRYSAAHLEDPAEVWRAHAAAVCQAGAAACSLADGAEGAQARRVLGGLWRELIAVADRAESGQLSVDWEAQALLACRVLVEGSRDAAWAERFEAASRRAGGQVREELALRAAQLHREAGAPKRCEGLLAGLAPQDPVLKVRLHLEGGILAAQTGRNELALERLQTALALAEDAEERGLESRAMTFLGVVSLVTGRRVEAAKLFSKAVYTAGLIGDLYAECLARLNHAVVLLEEDALVAARGELEKALSGAQHLNRSILVTSCRANLAACASGERSPDAVPLFEETLRLARRTGDLRFQAVACINLGRYSHAQGRLSAARRWLEEASDLAERCGAQTVACFANAHRMMLALETGDASQAAALRDQVPQQVGRASVRALCQVASGWLDLTLGQDAHQQPASGPGEPTTEIWRDGLLWAMALREGEEERIAQLEARIVAERQGPVHVDAEIILRVVPRLGL